MQFNLGDVLTAGAILIALITWWLTYRQERISVRHARTADIIANLSTSDTLSESAYHLTKLINTQDKKAVTYATIDASTERHVMNVLDYYEYLCELYQVGILSKRTITNLRGRLMVRTYDLCEDYIKGTRTSQGRKVYEAFELFVIEFKGKEVIVAQPSITSRKTPVSPPPATN